MMGLLHEVADSINERKRVQSKTRPSGLPSAWLSSIAGALIQSGSSVMFILVITSLMLLECPNFDRAKARCEAKATTDHLVQERCLKVRVEAHLVGHPDDDHVRGPIQFLGETGLVRRPHHLEPRDRL